MKNKQFSIFLVPMLLISLGSLLTFSRKFRVDKQEEVMALSSSVSSFSFENIALNAPPREVRLDVPLIAQKPELYNGCEVTSLTMLLNFKGVKVDKLTLVKDMKKDKTPMVKGKNGKIISWGNPDYGFVGDVTGKNGPGYSINPNALLPLAENYYEGQAMDLTNCTLEDLQLYLMMKSPVVVWVTCSMNVPNNFVIWKDGQGLPVKATFSQHAVVLTGYDENYFYYNDPLSKTKNAKISKEQFSKVWNAMGKKALSVR